MSIWIAIANKDIDFDMEQKEVNLLIDTGHNGNIYRTLTFGQIEDILYAIKEKQKIKWVKDREKTGLDMVKKLKRNGFFKDKKC